MFTAGSVLTASALNQLMPSGAILAYGGASAPSGWLLCDGASVLRADYSDLFDAIGTAFGAADGTHFNVPDLRGRFLRGADNAAGRDPDAAGRTAMATGGNTGDAVGSVQADEQESHTHTQDAHTHSLNANNRALYGGVNNVALGGATSVPNVQETATASATATNQATGGNETRPLNANVNFIIKT